MKRINDWKLSPIAKREVKKQLKGWIDEFTRRASGRTGSVEKCDFVKDELFFFTDCQDLMGDPESKAVEDEMKIRKRKRNVMMALFVKDLLGMDTGAHPHECSHCGYENMEIHTHSAGGYYRYCPKCDRLVVDTYVPYLIHTFRHLADKYMENKDDKKKK